MKHLTLLAAGLVALFVAGCGGNGESSTSTTTPTNNLGTPRIEAVVKIERTNLRDPSKYTDAELQDPTVVDPADLVIDSIMGVQDLNNFQASESYYLQLVAYDKTTKKRTILPAVFSTADTDFIHGVLGDSGLYLASTVPTGDAVSVKADYNGASYFSTYQLKERQVRYLGKVELETGAPADQVTVVFYDSTGLTTGSATSGYDGTFRASLPLRTVSFTIDPRSTLQGRTKFAFAGTDYVPSDPSGRPSLSFSDLTTYDDRANVITLKN